MQRGGDLHCGQIKAEMHGPDEFVFTARQVVSAIPSTSQQAGRRMKLAHSAFKGTLSVAQSGDACHRAKTMWTWNSGWTTATKAHMDSPCAFHFARESPLRCQTPHRIHISCLLRLSSHLANRVRTKPSLLRFARPPQEVAWHHLSWHRLSAWHRLSFLPVMITSSHRHTVRLVSRN